MGQQLAARPPLSGDPGRAQPALLTHLLSPALSAPRRSSCGQYVGGDGGRERTNRRSPGPVSAARSLRCSICMLGGLGVGSALLKGAVRTKAVLALFVLPFPTPFLQLVLEILEGANPPPSCVSSPCSGKRRTPEWPSAASDILFLCNTVTSYSESRKPGFQCSGFIIVLWPTPVKIFPFPPTLYIQCLTYLDDPKLYAFHMFISLFISLPPP